MNSHFGNRIQYSVCFYL